MEKLETTASCSPLRMIKTIREDRCALVQHPGQFDFVHAALVRWAQMQGTPCKVAQPKLTKKTVTISPIEAVALRAAEKVRCSSLSSSQPPLTTNERSNSERLKRHNALPSLSNQHRIRAIQHYASRAFPSLTNIPIKSAAILKVSAAKRLALVQNRSQFSSKKSTKKKLERRRSEVKRPVVEVGGQEFAFDGGGDDDEGDSMTREAAEQQGMSAEVFAQIDVANKGVVNLKEFSTFQRTQSYAALQSEFGSEDGAADASVVEGSIDDWELDL
jgi:hypothetical protein